MEMQTIPVHTILSDEHSQRIEFNEEKMSELVASIQSDGLLQPIVVKPIEGGHVVVAGHRRLEACKRLGWEEIPVVIAEGDEVRMRRVTFSENFFRDDLTPLELAVAIADEYKEARMTVEQLARGFNRTKEWVTRQLDVVSWPQDCLDAVHTGGLSIAAVRNLAAVDDNEYRQFLVKKAVETGASASLTAAWLQGFRAAAPGLALSTAAEGDASEPLLPAVPKAPCLGCATVFRVDGMSYVPLCQHCITVLSRAGSQFDNRPAPGSHEQEQLASGSQA